MINKSPKNPKLQRCDFLPVTTILTRLYAHIKQQELYYLRRLLFERKGCWSYKDIRKYNNVEYATYHAAADAIGLLKHDNDLFKCMEEAVQNETSIDRIMTLFVIILTSYHPNRSNEMWNCFKDAMKPHDHITLDWTIIGVFL